MQSHSCFSVTCPCGKPNDTCQSDGQAFTCACGRKSIIDFSIGYSERELVDILNRLDTQRDHVAKVIELRRERRAA